MTTPVPLAERLLPLLERSEEDRKALGAPPTKWMLTVASRFIARLEAVCGEEAWLYAGLDGEICAKWFPPGLSVLLSQDPDGKFLLYVLTTATIEVALDIEFVVSPGMIESAASQFSVVLAAH